jgi:hypothetical protein
MVTSTPIDVPTPIEFRKTPDSDVLTSRNFREKNLERSSFIDPNQEKPQY